MLASKPETLTRFFLKFASEASNVLHIKTEQDYQGALDTIEHLFSEAKDTADDPLNDLIELVSKSIEKYEATQEAMIAFDKEANETNQ